MHLLKEFYHLQCDVVALNYSVDWKKVIAFCADFPLLSECLLPSACFLGQSNVTTLNVSAFDGTGIQVAKPEIF